MTTALIWDVILTPAHSQTSMSWMIWTLIQRPMALALPATFSSWQSLSN
jgi:hypothetical protein